MTINEAIPIALIAMVFIFVLGLFILSVSSGDTYYDWKIEQERIEYEDEIKTLKNDDKRNY